MINIPDTLTGFYDWVLTSVMYDPGNPLFFTGGFFMFFFLLFFLVSIPFGRTPQRRTWIILFFSLWFYYKCSGAFAGLIVAAGTMNYLVARAMGPVTANRRRALLLFAGILVNLALLLLFKYTPYYNKVAALIADGNWSIAHMAFPAGLSFYTFANLSYLIDVREGVIQPERSLPGYLAYITFFPIVQMGPIERAKNFLPQLSKPFRLSGEDVSEGFMLIMSGAFKKMVIGDYVNIHLVSQVFSMPDRHTGMENLAAILGYSLVIYCDFSGYTDMARGIARWMGFSIQLNFNFPYRSDSIGQFWRRWHISLSSWLRDYLFLPLAYRLSRLMKGEYLLHGKYLRTDIVIFNIAALVTFTVCGLWHGIGWNFLIWGLMHGMALAIQRTWSYATRNFKKKRGQGFREINRAAGVMLTFVFVSCSWVFFRMQSPGDSIMVFSQVAGNFYLQGFPAFISAYYPVLLMMALGYALHFFPDRMRQSLTNKMIPSEWYWKTLLAIAMVSLIVYFKTLGSAMPIYIQF